MAQRRSTTGGATAARPPREDGEADAGVAKDGDAGAADTAGAGAEAAGSRAVAEPEQALGYEAARDQLIDVVRRLEAGGTTLEESLALWERGEQLAAVCQRWLDGARARLEAVTGGEATADGERAEGRPR